MFEVGRRRTSLIAALALCAGVASVPAFAESQPPLVVPFGVVDLGDRVAFEIDDCETVSVHVEATTPGGTVSGPSVAGCAGSVHVPGLAAVNATGWSDDGPLELAVVGGGQRVPLRYMRLQAELGVPAGGSPEILDSVTDPRGGGGGVALGSGDVIDLGQADLRKIRSISIRSSASLAGACDAVALGSCVPTLVELRHGSAAGPAIAVGELGPVGIVGVYNPGWPNSWIMSSWKLLGDLPQGPVNLYLAVVVAPSDVIVNWVDLNGSGVREPRVDDAPASTRTIFDGTSFDGWTSRGFTLQDGAMRAESSLDPGDVSWLDPIAADPTDPIAYANAGGSSITSHETFRDVVIRLQFRHEHFEDNGSVILGPVEIQMTDTSEWFTGGLPKPGSCLPPVPAWRTVQPDADCGVPAERVKSGVFPDWSQLEVVQNGDTWVVRIEGREVSRTTASVAEAFPITLNNTPLFSRRASTPGEWGAIWYRSIRVYDCSGPNDPECSTEASH